MSEQLCVFYAAKKYLQETCREREELYCLEDLPPVLKLSGEKGLAHITETEKFYSISVSDAGRSQGVDSFVFFKTGDVNSPQDPKTRLGRNLSEMVGQMISEKEWHESWKNQVKNTTR